MRKSERLAGKTWAVSGLTSNQTEVSARSKLRPKAKVINTNEKIRMINLALIGMSEDKRERGRRRLLDTPILMLEGLLQKMAESDITE